MTEYNIFAGGRLVGCMYREGGEWWADNGTDTEVMLSIRESTAVLEERGYTVVPTAMGGLTRGGGVSDEGIVKSRDYWRDVRSGDGKHRPTRG